MSAAVRLVVDIESFWTEGYAGQIPNSGHELDRNAASPKKMGGQVVI